MQARALRAARVRAAQPALQPSSVGWTPLGPVPLASDATGDGFQNYDEVSGRATAVAIDPADPTGDTIYIGERRAECGSPPTPQTPPPT
jgi:hypothetical protein